MESMCNADFVITSPSTPCTVLPPRDRTTKTGNAGFRRGQLKATSGTRNACGESSVAWQCRAVASVLCFSKWGPRVSGTCGYFDEPYSVIGTVNVSFLFDMIRP